MLEGMQWGGVVHRNRSAPELVEPALARDRELARMFVKNFERFADSVPVGLIEAGPRSD